MAPISKLFLPPSSLAACVFACIYRDTRGSALSDRDRLNHFPASPLVSVTLVDCGELRLLTKGQDWASAKDAVSLPRIYVLGPQENPVSSWSIGQIRAITLGIYPDAWLRLGGSEDYLTAPKPLVQALESFAAMEDPERAWGEVCKMLLPLWENHRPSSLNVGNEIADWARNLIARVALSTTGQSLRSFERKLKRFSGHSRQALDFYSSFENLHRVARLNTDGAPADIALEAGYADQSHMGRAVQRATGLSPARLNRAIETQEAFWCYRLLGERF